MSTFFSARRKSFQHFVHAPLTRGCRWLLEFLDLPSDNRRVKELSGGQKRRLSLAVT